MVIHKLQFVNKNYIWEVTIIMKYIALLRGINISGKNKVSMNELKLVLEKKISKCFYLPK